MSWRGSGERAAWERHGLDIQHTAAALRVPTEELRAAQADAAATVA